MHYDIDRGHIKSVDIEQCAHAFIGEFQMNDLLAGVTHRVVVRGLLILKQCFTSGQVEFFDEVFTGEEFQVAVDSSEIDVGQGVVQLGG